MLGQHWEEEHYDQFQNPNFVPIHKNYEQDSYSFSGELRYSSSECSSYVGSPNSIGTTTTTYGAQSPTISYAVNDHYQGVQLQHNEECPSSIIESMNRATPYSPQEKKERIERYRSKRHLRNFNKKIKYECRKTLADSRPRVRGRFAKNDETGKAAAAAISQYIIEEDYVNDDYNWIGILDAFSTNFIP